MITSEQWIAEPSLSIVWSKQYEMTCPRYEIINAFTIPIGICWLWFHPFSPMWEATSNLNLKVDCRNSYNCRTHLDGPRFNLTNWSPDWTWVYGTKHGIHFRCEITEDKIWNYHGVLYNDSIILTNDTVHYNSTNLFTLNWMKNITIISILCYC